MVRDAFLLTYTGGAKLLDHGTADLPLPMIHSLVLQDNSKGKTLVHRVAIRFWRDSHGYVGLGIFLNSV